MFTQDSSLGFVKMISYALQVTVVPGDNHKLNTCVVHIISCIISSIQIKLIQYQRWSMLLLVVRLCPAVVQNIRRDIQLTGSRFEMVDQVEQCRFGLRLLRSTSDQ